LDLTTDRRRRPSASLGGSPALRGTGWLTDRPGRVPPATTATPSVAPCRAACDGSAPRTPPLIRAGQALQGRRPPRADEDGDCTGSIASAASRARAPHTAATPRRTSGRATGPPAGLVRPARVPGLRTAASTMSGRPPANRASRPRSTGSRAARSSASSSDGVLVPGLRVGVASGALVVALRVAPTRRRSQVDSVLAELWSARASVPVDASDPQHAVQSCPLRCVLASPDRVVAVCAGGQVV
jgi:hypothetical protein